MLEAVLTVGKQRSRPVAKGSWSVTHRRRARYRRLRSACMVGHGQLSDSAAAPPHASHAVLTERRPRSSKSDRDRIGGRQQPERGNESTKITRRCHHSILRGTLCVLVLSLRFATPHRAQLKNWTSRIQAIDPRWEEGWAGRRRKGWTAVTASGGCRP